MGEKTLFQCVTLPGTVCEIEATVCSGLESMAKEEIEEKLGGQVNTGRGHANMFISLSDVNKVRELRSVDNLMLIASRFPQFHFSKDLTESLEQIRSFVPNVDWAKLLQVWSQFFTFAHHISPTPDPRFFLADKESSGNSTNDATTSIPGTSDDNINECVDSLKQLAVNDSCNTECLSGIDGNELKKEIKKTQKRSPKNPLLPSFRATCYRTGVNHAFQSPQAACSFGGAIHDYFGWNVDLENHDLEIVICIDDDDVRIGVTLTKESLHRRDIVKFGPTTLRPTIAYGMLRLCKIQPGEIVCDPMCGGGSIPVESAISWDGIHNICGDISNQCTARTTNNVRAVNAKRATRQKSSLNLDVVQWDACSLPLKDNSIDVFITDLPFGKRSGSWNDNKVLYPRMLHELARVCKLETGRACLLTHDRRCIQKSLLTVSSLWRRGPTVGINIGGLASGIFLLYRTAMAVHKESTDCNKETKD